MSLDAEEVVLESEVEELPELVHDHIDSDGDTDSDAAADSSSDDERTLPVRTSSRDR